MATAKKRKSAKKRVAKKSAAPSAAKRKAVVRKSLADVKKAQRNLDLKVKKHHAVVSAMFFIG
jgi:hypothetical protein